jgi:hypothetical protein
VVSSTTKSFLDCLRISDDSHPQRDAIRAAISEMRKQSRNDFVVLDGPSSDQYVQFCNGDRGAVMDMPKRAGSGSMAERAAAFLDQHGFELTKYDEGETYLREFDPDEIEEMISIAIRAFRGIYALPPKTRLQIVRGWD